MGGLGSGRQWYDGAQKTTSDFRSLDVRRLHKKGLLQPDHSFVWQWLRNAKKGASIRVCAAPDRIILSYRCHRGHDDWVDEHYPVQLSWTRCGMGGERPWFICPTQGCGRRVALLYSGGLFSCRHCRDLAYPSQREASSDRAVRKANRIRKKLDWASGILNDHGGKPKGMHWNPYFLGIKKSLISEYLNKEFVPLLTQSYLPHKQSCGI